MILLSGEVGCVGIGIEFRLPRGIANSGDADLDCLASSGDPDLGPFNAAAEATKTDDEVVDAEELFITAEGWAKDGLCVATLDTTGEGVSEENECREATFSLCTILATAPDTGFRVFPFMDDASEG